jgi:hypothetical protein
VTEKHASQPLCGGQAVEGGLGRADAALLGIALLFLAVLFLWLTFVRPRPYTIMENDLENESFYNSLTLRDGFYAQGPGHPGTPARYAYLFLFSIFGTDTGPHWQTAMNWAYGALALLTAVAAVGFYLVVRRSHAAGVTFLSLACALTSPPGLNHLNHFGSDALILPAGLLLIGLFWATLVRNRRPGGSALLAFGALCGLCLSIKLSFAPLVAVLVAVLATAILTCWREQPFGLVQRLESIASLCAAMVVTHVVVCLPLQTDLINLWRFTLARSQSHLGSGSWLLQAVQSTWLLFTVNPILTAVIAVASAVATARVVSSLRGLRGRALTAAVPSLLLVAGSAVALAYGLMVSAKLVGKFQDAGEALRYAGPVLLVVPLFVLIATPDRMAGKRSGTWVLAVTGIAMMVSSGAIYAARRDRFIVTEERSAVAVTKRLAELREKGTRVAFWNHASRAAFGEATFRLWGNYLWYRQEAYDDETLARFPQYTFLRLREIRVPDIASEVPSRSAAPPSSGWFRSVVRRALHWRIPGWFPHRDTSAYGMVNGRSALFTGEARGVRVSVVAYPLADERYDLHVTRGQLLDLLARRLGPLKAWEEDLAGKRWVIIKVASPSTARCNGLAMGPRGARYTIETRVRPEQ